MKKLYLCFNCFTREKLTLLIGSLALLIGAKKLWYNLPPQALEIFGTNLFLANALRFLPAFFAFLSLFYIFFQRIASIPRLPFWVGLITVLLFPYFTTYFSQSVYFIAKNYYEQGIRVSSHIEKNFPEIQALWKQNIFLQQAVRVPSTFEFYIKDSRFFQASSWDPIVVEGLGYNNYFFGFISRGWLLAVIGLAISLIAIYLSFKDEMLDIFIKDMLRLLPWNGLLVGILVSSLILPNFINYQLDTMFAKGEYHQVLVASKALEFWFPPLRGNEEFLKRMGEVAFYGNESEPASLYFAKGLERYRQGDLLKAEEYFQQSLKIQPRRFLVRGYLAATLLNQGVGYFNSSDTPNTFNAHNPSTAAECFEKALQIFPGHIEALYDLMLARVVNGEFAKSAAIAQQLIETQQYPQQSNLALLGQAHLHLSWASYHNGHSQESWKQYRQSIDPSTWKKFANDEAQPQSLNHEAQ